MPGIIFDVITFLLSTVIDTLFFPFLLLLHVIECQSHIFIGHTDRFGNEENTSRKWREVCTPSSSTRVWLCAVSVHVMQNWFDSRHDYQESRVSCFTLSLYHVFAFRHVRTIWSVIWGTIWSKCDCQHCETKIKTLKKSK